MDWHSPGRRLLFPAETLIIGCLLTELRALALFARRPYGSCDRWNGVRMSILSVRIADLRVRPIFRTSADKP